MLKFTPQLEAPLSEKRKTFSGFFFAFFKSALNLEHLEKKGDYRSLVISRIIDFEGSGKLNV